MSKFRDHKVTDPKIRELKNIRILVILLIFTVLGVSIRIDNTIDKNFDMMRGLYEEE